MPGQYPVAEAGSESLDLRLDSICRVERSSRAGHGCTPRPCASHSGARESSKRLGWATSRKGLSGTLPAQTAASASAISASVPPMCTVPPHAVMGSFQGIGLSSAKSTL